MTVIVLIAFRVIKWKMGISLRYSFVVVVSTPVTLFTYGVFVRRWRVARFLLGMKPGEERAATEGPAWARLLICININQIIWYI